MNLVFHYLLLCVFEALKNEILFLSRWKYKRAQLQKESNPSTFFTLSSAENYATKSYIQKMVLRKSVICYFFNNNIRNYYRCFNINI